MTDNRHILARQMLMLCLLASIALIVLGQVSPADLVPPRPGLEEGLHRLNATIFAYIDGRQDLLTVCGFMLLLSTFFLSMVAALVEHYANKAGRADREDKPEHPVS